MNLPKLSVLNVILVLIAIFHFGAGRTSPSFVFGSSSYTFHENPLRNFDWKKSRQQCTQSGSDLVSIESAREWIFLKNTMQRMKTVEYFIGLKKDSKSGEWRWISDNSKVNTTKEELPWVKGEPSGDGNCAVMFKDYRKEYGRFNDVRCALVHSRGYICESPASSSDRNGRTSPSFVFGNSSYTFHKMSPQYRNWEESRESCKKIESDLVSIESKKEWFFLKETIQKDATGEYFIGLKKDWSGEWRWISDNSKVNATREKFPWAQANPSGDGNCAVMYKDYLQDYGLFNDLKCTVKRKISGYICESSVNSNDHEVPTVKPTSYRTEGGTKGSGTKTPLRQSLTVTSAVRLTTSKSPSTQAPSKGKTSPSFVFGNSIYAFHKSSQFSNWKESRKSCKDTGGDLVSIETEKEWFFLKETIKTNAASEYFVGLKKDSKSREWRWISDNSKVNATKGEFPWAKGQPTGDGNCAVMYKDYRHDYGLFNDLSCTHKRKIPGYICESFVNSNDQEVPTVKPRS